MVEKVNTHVPLFYDKSTNKGNKKAISKNLVNTYYLTLGYSLYCSKVKTKPQTITSFLKIQKKTSKKKAPLFS